MAGIPIPRPHSRRISKIEGDLELNRWASDIDQRIVEILDCLGQSIQRVNKLTTHSTPGAIGAHAPQHYPQTGFDPLLTAAHTGGYGLTTTVGVSDNLLRADARLAFPSALMSSVTSTVTLTDDLVDQTLTGNLGVLKFVSGDHRIFLDFFTGAGALFPVNSTVMGVGGRTSSMGNTLRISLDASMIVDDTAGSYNGATFIGMRFAATMGATNITYTNCNFDGAQINMSGGGTLLTTSSFTQTRGLAIAVTTPGEGASGVVSVTNAYGIQIQPWSGLVFGSPSYTNCYGLHITFPRVGNTIRRGIHLDTNANNTETEAANTDQIYISRLQRGTGIRCGIQMEGHTSNAATATYGILMGGQQIGTTRYGLSLLAHTAGSCTTGYGIYMETPQIGTTRYGIYCEGTALTAGATNVYGVFAANHTQGTNRWSFYGANKMECTTSDMICSTAAKGFISKDAQGTARYWRQYISTSGTTSVDAIYSVDVNGILSVTRGASAAGTVIFNVQDVGTAAPTQ